MKRARRFRSRRLPFPDRKQSERDYELSQLTGFVDPNAGRGAVTAANPGRFGPL
jgi:hypothetical protein